MIYRFRWINDRGEIVINGRSTVRAAYEAARQSSHNGDQQGPLVLVEG